MDRSVLRITSPQSRLMFEDISPRIKTPILSIYYILPPIVSIHYRHGKTLKTRGVGFFRWMSLVSPHNHWSFLQHFSVPSLGIFCGREQDSGALRWPGSRNFFRGGASNFGPWSWQFCWWPLWDGENVTLFNGCWWPPTIGDEKVTNWITWMGVFLFVDFVAWCFCQFFRNTVVNLMKVFEIKYLLKFLRCFLWPKIGFWRPHLLHDFRVVQHQIQLRAVLEELAHHWDSVKAERDVHVSKKIPGHRNQHIPPNGKGKKNNLPLSFQTEKGDMICFSRMVFG